MGVAYRTSGKLCELLLKFKNEFLTQLTEDDLNQSVVLSVNVVEEEEPSPIEEESEWLRKKLVEVIENE